MTGDRTPLRERLVVALPCPICHVPSGKPCRAAGAVHEVRVQAADAVLPVVEAEVSRRLRSYEPPDELRTRLIDAIRRDQTPGPTVTSAADAVLPLFADEHERARQAEQAEFTAHRRAERAEAAVERVREAIADLTWEHTMVPVRHIRAALEPKETR